MSSSVDRRLRALRPPRPGVDPWRPLDVVEETERSPAGELQPGLTVFLAGAECAFTCVFCDLWRYTLEEPTPPGAIPAQIENALRGARASARWIKLYNASNFFAPRAVPVEDLRRVLELVADMERVIVECHPRLVGDQCFEFGDGLAGRLEVAMGLETIHPEVLPRLNKQMDLEIFEAACGRLRERGLGIRAFVLVGTPWTPPEEYAQWAWKSAEWALDRGVEVVSLIPVRPGNGEMERLAGVGDWTAPTMAQVEDALDLCLALDRGVVLVDPWDLEPLATCGSCRELRLRRIVTLNETGRFRSRVPCAACGARSERSSGG